jgi:hypothetical protein
LSIDVKREKRREKEGRKEGRGWKEGGSVSSLKVLRCLHSLSLH